MCAVRSVLQCVVACCSDVALSAVSTSRGTIYAVRSVLQCVAVCCSDVAVCALTTTGIREPPFGVPNLVNYALQQGVNSSQVQYFTRV